jgi:RNA polymerase sigma-70 factor (ECF subfamily)
MQVEPAYPGSSTLLDLVRRTAAGDRRAFAALYDDTSAKLFGVALRILRQRDLAEDVMQESFVIAWERARDFDPVRGSVMSWLVTIVRHRAIDLLRRRASRGDHRTDGDDALLGLAAGETDRADRGAELGALQRCLGELDPQPRKVVLMSYAYGYTHEELADRLSVPMGTVKSWIRRSLERLRACLDG